MATQILTGHRCGVHIDGHAPAAKKGKTRSAPGGLVLFLGPKERRGWGSLEKREASSSRLAAYLLGKGYLLTLEHLVITYYKISWRREWQPILVFLCGESYKQRSLAGYSPWGHRVRHDGAHTHTIQGACVCSAVSECPWNFPGKNTGVGCHSLLYEIFRTQELNLRLSCLLHWQADSLPLCCYSVAQLCPTLCNPVSSNILGT